jgi:hypothetical protein
MAGDGKVSAARRGGPTSAGRKRLSELMKEALGRAKKESQVLLAAYGWWCTVNSAHRQSLPNTCLYEPAELVLTFTSLWHS